MSSRTARAIHTGKKNQIHQIHICCFSPHLQCASRFPVQFSPDESNVFQKVNILFLFSALEEVLPQDTKVALLQEEGTTSLVLMTLAQKRVLMLLMKQPEDEISEVEAAVAPLEVSRIENSWLKRPRAQLGGL